MRIDKFLKNSRIIKRRTVAKEACEQGRILLNDKTKPSLVLKCRREMRSSFSSATAACVWKSWHFWNPAGKEDAVKMYRVIE